MRAYRERLAAGVTRELIDQVRSIARPLDHVADLDPLMDRIGDARCVMLGEASHGTSEYYTWRAKLSQRLISEKGFSFIAVEGDWPDCYSVNRYIKGYPDSGDSAVEVLHRFSRWPTWMWANWEVAALAEWLKRHNHNLADDNRVGFYGLDVYSLWESMEAITDYLEDVDPDLIQTAAQAYKCFEPFGEDAQAYAQAVAFVPESCEDEVVELLARIRSKAKQYDSDREAGFNVEQNAYVVLNAERYYRAMVRGGANTWNIRDEHMADTLERLMSFHGDHSKAIVWEHNTHIGDARATDMADEGMFNIGQLMRDRREPDDVVLVGFGSYSGTVVAGRSWGAPMQRMSVPPAVEGSWEEVLHRADNDNKLLILSDAEDSREFMQERGHRAIGVVYNPALERYGNYVPTILPLRYDAFLHIDHTQAVHPLHIEPKEGPEPPETYPWAI